MVRFLSSTCVYNKLNLELIVFSLNSQIGDSRIESQVERVDGNFLKNPDPIAY